MSEGPHRSTEEWKQAKVERKARTQEMYESRRIADHADGVAPYVGNEYVCPNCNGIIQTYLLRTLFKPPSYAHLLNDIIKCCFCGFFFSYHGVPIRAVKTTGGKPAGSAMSG